MYASNIEEHEALAAAPTAAEKRYRSRFEAAADGILILDAASGTIIDVNPCLVRLLGYTRHELVDKPLWDVGLFENANASRHAFTRLQTEGYLRYEDLPLRPRDGRSIDVELVSSVCILGNRDVIQCNIRDISRRKLAETEKVRLTMARDIVKCCGIGFEPRRRLSPKYPWRVQCFSV